MEIDGMKKLFWLAECEEVNYHQVFDATYAWRFLHTMEAYWKKQKDIAAIDADLKSYDQDFPPQAIRALFTSNHDENSHSGSEYERMGDAAIPFAVLCCTWNGIPLIYTGQELPNKKRLKFFDKDFVDWTNRCALNDFYSTFLHLRKRNRALRAGDPEVRTYRLKTNCDTQVFSFVRKNAQQEVLVFLNLSETAIECTIDDPAVGGVFTDVFTGTTFDSYKIRNVELDSWGYRVFEKQ